MFTNQTSTVQNGYITHTFTYQNRNQHDIMVYEYGRLHDPALCHVNAWNVSLPELHGLPQW